MDIEKYKEIEKWATELDGVFTIADLKVVLNENAEPTLYRAVARLVGSGTLFKVKRGVYVTANASLATISSRIEPNAYISTGTVLARHAIIGSIPAHKVQAIKVGRPRLYSCALGTIEHLSICPHLYFGFDDVAGIRIASPEKAFLDVCYFTYRGHRFSFDPDTDVNLDSLDFDRIERDLGAYDPRFVSFFNRHWKRP
jgi:hypothetical protein